MLFVELQVESMNKTTMNVTVELTMCKDQLEQPTTAPPTTSSSTTQIPTTIKVSTSSPITRMMTTETATVPPVTPCTTPDPIPLNNLKANITQLEQQLQQETNRSSGLRLQLSNEQTKSSHLQQQVSDLQVTKDALNVQLQRCQVSQLQAKKDLQICQSSVKATNVPSIVPSIPQSQHDFIIMQHQIDNLTIENNRSILENRRLLTEIEQAKLNITELRHQLETKPPLATDKTGDSESSYDWSSLLESTPGQILIAIAGGFFILFVIFFITTICCHMKNRQDAKSPRKYDVQLANMAYDYRNGGYVADGDDN